MDVSQFNPDQYRTFKKSPKSSPIVMLNLLKFKPEDGARAYRKYIAIASSKVEEVGGRVIYLGQPAELLQGEEAWDLLMLVEYPSRQAFQQMIKDPEYQAAHQYREKAVERAVLYATDPIAFKDIK